MPVKKSENILLWKLYYQFPETLSGDCIIRTWDKFIYIIREMPEKLPTIYISFGWDYKLTPDFCSLQDIVCTKRTNKVQISLFSQQRFWKQKDSIIFSILVTTVTPASENRLCTDIVRIWLPGTKSNALPPHRKLGDPDDWRDPASVMK